MNARGVIAAAIIAFLLKLYIAATTFGTNDVIFWESSWMASISPAGITGLYRNGLNMMIPGSPIHPEVYVHTPFDIHLISVLEWICKVTNWSFPFTFRALSALCDFGSVLVLLQLVGAGSRKTFSALVIVALSPVGMMISGFHGNVDAPMMFFLLLTVLALEKKWKLVLAGVLFGMSMNFKIWPMLLGPAILAWLPEMRQRAIFTVSAAATVFVGWLPPVVQDPLLIAERILGYKSLYGQWGISRILSLISAATGWTVLNQAYEVIGKTVLTLVLFGLGIWLQKRYPKSSLGLRLGLLTAVFMVLTSGFGVQYLAWVAPWGAFVGPEILMLVHFSSGVFLYTVYNYWSAGVWNFADSINKPAWSGTIIFYELLAWFGVIALVRALFLKITGELWGKMELPQQKTVPVIRKKKKKSSAR